MKKENETNRKISELPVCAAEYIRLVIKKMRYRREVRQDVQAELTAHFEDELKECTTDEDKEKKAEQLITDFGDVKLLAVLLRRAKKRCRPLWRTIVARTFQTIGVLILCFVLYCVYISLGRPTISVNYIEEMTRLARPVVDEGQNAAPLYQKAVKLYSPPGKIKIKKKIDFDYYEDFDFPGPYIPLTSPNQPKPAKDYIIEEVSLLEAIKGKEWPSDLTEDQISLLKEWISGNSEALELFKQGTQKPYCWWQRQAKDEFVLNVLMPELSSIRKLVRLLCWQAKLRAYKGDIQKAFDDLLACYRAGKHFKGPRLLIEQLVGIAIQALTAKTAIIILDKQHIQGQLLKEFQGELEKLMDEDTFIANYKVERFFVLDFIQRCYTDNGRGSGHMIPGRVKEFWQAALGDVPESEVFDYGRFLTIAVVGADRRELHRTFERAYNNLQKWAYKTPWQLREENVDLEMGFADWSFLKRARYWPVSVFMPAGARINELAYRHKIDIEALITIIGLLRYNQDKGQYPQNLDKLVTAGYIKQLPMDPWSDNPLVYKKTDDNFILYSVGLNFKDDGGEIVIEDDGRIRLWGTPLKPGDAVFWPIQK